MSGSGGVSVFLRREGKQIQFQEQCAKNASIVKSMLLDVYLAKLNKTKENRTQPDGIQATANQNLFGVQ